MAFKKKNKLEKKEIVEEPKLEVKEEPQPIMKGDYILKVNFTKQYKKGMSLPKEKYDELKSRGIDIDSLVE